MQLELKYGCNPHQQPARLSFDGPRSPLRILNGVPGYINLLDAFNAWQLAKELSLATGQPGAASFKHVSPAGAAIAKPLSPEFLESQFLEPQEYSPIASAYIRARGGDRLCSYGDVAAVSDRVDLSLATFLKQEVCDLIIAPDYEPAALELLKSKQNGRFIILQMDPDYEPPDSESRMIYGFGMEQQRNSVRVSAGHFANIVSDKRELAAGVLESLIVATIALKYTQSNSVCVAYDGQVIGMGAGQQSRVHCTRLACDKADKWLLQQHPAIRTTPFITGLKKTEKTNLIDQILLWDELSEPERDLARRQLSGEPVLLSRSERLEWITRHRGLCLSSDAFIPFRDNVDRAWRSGVECIAHAGQALRDDAVSAAANGYGMVMIHTSLRLFTH